MRLNELKLARYGHFTDFNLDFGDQNTLTSDLHIIYGENEAGKSTTLSAIVDLLYGIEARSQFNFLHNYQTMEIAASILQGDQTLQLRRNKKGLADSELQPLPPTTIDTHGLSRDDFQSRFSFNEETLKVGGEAILGNNGDLGTALFSATSGISDFAAALEKQLEPANRFYEPNKSKGKMLNEIKDELKQIKDEVKQLDIDSTKWGKKEKLANELKERFEDFKQKTDKQKIELDQLNRQQQAFGIAGDYNILKLSLAASAELPKVPSNWLTEARPLISKQSENQSVLNQFQTQLTTLTTELSNCKVDKKLSLHAPTIKILSEQRALFDQRALDLSSKRQELNLLFDEQSKLQNEIESPDYDADKDELLTQAKINELQKHGAAYTELNTELSRAQKEQQNIDKEREQLEKNEIGSVVDTSALNNFLALITEKGNSFRHSQISDQLKTLTNELDVQLAKLNPWQGDKAQLLKLAVPSTDNLKNLDTQLTQITNAIKSCDSNIQQIETDIRVLTENTEQTSATDITNRFNELRRERNNAWNLHVEALDTKAPRKVLSKQAREFSLTQQKLDEATDAEIQNAANRGAIEASQAQHEQLNIKFANENDALNANKKHEKSLLKTISKEAESLGLANNFSPSEIIDWLDLREATIETIHNVDMCERDFSEISKIITDETTRLRTLVVEVDKEAANTLSSMEDPNEIIAIANTIKTRQEERNNEIAQQQEALSSLATRRKLRQKELDEAQTKFDHWAEQWEALLSSTWIKERDMDNVNATLATIQKLINVESQVTEQQRSVASLASTQTQFETEANELLILLGRKSTKPLPQKLNTLFEDAQLNNEQVVKQKQLNQNETDLVANIATQQTALLPIKSQLDDMLSKCGVTDTAELETTLENIKTQADQQMRLAEQERNLISILKVDSLDSALKGLTELDEHTLTSTIRELNIEIERDEVTLDELRREYHTAQDELDKFNSNARVAQLTQTKQSLILDLEENAMQTMRLRLGKLAIEQGIRQFREKHRSSMLENARTAFVAITGGNYSDLTTQPGKKNSEELVGIKVSGQSTLASSMSTGTRAQLYLALRIAAYQDYCKTREPLPFVADDIMETFDEQRTEATLQLLNGMAKQGQIIYLTHHKHVLDIARDKLGDQVQVHKLPKRKPILSVVT